MPEADQSHIEQVRSRRGIRFAVIVVLAAVVYGINRHETWVVIVLLFVPVLYLALRYKTRPAGGDASEAPEIISDDEIDEVTAESGAEYGDVRPITPHPIRRNRLWITIILAGVIAVLLHVQMSRLLAGSIQPLELLWTFWFAFAALLTLNLAVTATRNWADSLPRYKAAAHLLRLLVIAAVTLPVAAALLQTIRVRVGYTIPQVPPFTYEVFDTAGEDGLSIRGYFYDRGQPTTVIVTHGLGAHSENFMPFLFESMARLPVNGLAFDFRGHGYSDGHVSSFGYHERKDVEAALAWLSEHHPEAAQQLIYQVFSMGSAAALPVAAEHPNTVAVVVDSGFAELPAVAVQITRQFPAPLQAPFYRAGIAAASIIAEAPIESVRPVEAIERLRERGVPVMVMHGGADVMIPPSQGDALRAAAGGAGRTIEGAGHTGLPAMDYGYFREVAEFMRQALEHPEPVDDRIERDGADAVGGPGGAEG